MGNTITINDGLKKYEIKNQHGELLGELYFNPTDSDIMTRYTAGVKELKERLKEADNKQESTIEDVIAEDEFIKKTIDKIFNAPISDKFFSIMGIRSMVNGKYYFEFVIEVLGRIIKEEANKQNLAMKKRIEKYGERYQ